MQFRKLSQHQFISWFGADRATGERMGPVIVGFENTCPATIGSMIRKWAILSFHVVLLALKWTGTWSRSRFPKWYKAPPKCAVSSKGSPVKALQAMFYKGLGGKPVCLCLTAISMCLLCVYGHAAGLEKSFTAVSNGPEEDFGRLIIWLHLWSTNFTTWKIIFKKACVWEKWLNQIISKSDFNMVKRNDKLIIV